MRKGLLVALFASAAAASAGEAPSRLGLAAMLLGANDEVGGVDEVDTYPSGLPQVEPEVVSPPLRPGLPPALPVQPPPGYRPPGYQPPGYRPPVPVKPPRRGRGWRYKTVLSSGRSLKELYGWPMERDEYGLKLLFKKANWDGSVPFDHFEGRDGVGYISIRATPPGSGYIWDAFGRKDQDGAWGGMKLYLADGLSVEGYFTGLTAHDIWLDSYLDYCRVEEHMFGVRAELLLGDGLSLWYARRMYTTAIDTSMLWDDWQYEWNTYGADWLFPLGKQHFKVGFSKSDQPTMYFWFEGPFEETKIEFSWFPYKQLKLAFGFKQCPDSYDDSQFFVAKWDLASWLGLGAYYESSGGSPVRISASAALRF